MSFLPGSFARLRAIAYAVVAALMLWSAFDAVATDNYFGVGCALVTFLYFGWKCAEI